MNFSIKYVQKKIKRFIKSNLNNEILQNYGRKFYQIIKIYLEDIETFDKELYFFLIKKPEKIILLFEFTLKNLINKNNNICDNKSNNMNFQLMLQRRIFYPVPKNFEDSANEGFISLKVIIESFGTFKLKNDSRIDQFYNQKRYSDIQVNSPKNLIELELEKTREFSSYSDYQTILAAGFKWERVKQQSTLKLILILELF